MRRALAAALLAIALPGAAGPTDPTAASATLAETRTEERKVLDELAASDRALNALREELDALVGQAEALAAVERQRQAELDAAEAQLGARRAETVGRLTALYQLERRGLAQALFGAESASDLRRRARYLRALMDHERSGLREHTRLVEQRRAALTSQQKAAADLAAVRAEVDARQAALLEERGARLALLDDIRTRRELAMAALAELAAAQRGLETTLAPTAYVPGASGAASFRGAFGRLPWPANGRIVRRYGAAANASRGLMGESLGLDLAVAPGAPFRAVYEGTVRLASEVPGYGLCVAVEHGPFTTVYAHAASLAVRRGDAVQAGTVLGVAGDSGLVGGECCTLTFEVRYNGTAQDPLPWLTRAP